MFGWSSLLPAGSLSFRSSSVNNRHLDAHLRAPDDRPVDDDPGLDPREAARARRRDHDASAEARDLLRPGMGKVFKQIQYVQRRVAESPTPGGKRAKGGGSS
jgi:hypothetical protein